MEQQFVPMEYIQLAADILVPLSWPIQGMENFVLRAVRRIIETSQHNSPVIIINKVPVRLIRNFLGFPFVCQLLNEQITEDNVYEIIPHVDENNNNIEITSGSDPGPSEIRRVKMEPVCLLRTRVITLSLVIKKFQISDQE